jgi:hypothetical protein
MQGNNADNVIELGPNARHTCYYLTWLVVVAQFFPQSLKRPPGLKLGGYDFLINWLYPVFCCTDAQLLEMAGLDTLVRMLYICHQHHAIVCLDTQRRPLPDCLCLRMQMFYRGLVLGVQAFLPLSVLGGVMRGSRFL